MLWFFSRFCGKHRLPEATTIRTGTASSQKVPAAPWPKNSGREECERRNEKLLRRKPHGACLAHAPAMNQRIALHALRVAVQRQDEKRPGRGIKRAT